MVKVLVLTSRYLPGYKSGGPQQTIMNICDIYKDKAEIYICTMNSDMGETIPYDLPVDTWLDKYGIKIMYVKPRDYSFKLFKRLYAEFDIIYTCSLFAVNSYQMMIINKVFHDKIKNLYVAPMGVFGEGAIASKHMKKVLFLMVCKWWGLDRDIIWSFTSEEERKDAEMAFGKTISNYIIAEDIPRKPENQQIVKHCTKERGSLSIIFLSRISPQKNLLGALDILKEGVDGNIIFDIYGALEDESYWIQCQDKIRKMPSNVVVHYKGTIRTEEVISTFGKYDVFLFPTKGENFGHVIYESLLGGCIPVISDTTPWKDFERKDCGAVIKLEDIYVFRTTLNRFVAMDVNELKKLKYNAHIYAEEKYKTIIDNSGYNKVFLDSETKK